MPPPEFPTSAIVSPLPYIGKSFQAQLNKEIPNNHLFKKGFIKAFDIEDMAEKIELLIENKNLRENFSNNALKDTEKFDLKNIIKKWTNILESI